MKEIKLAECGLSYAVVSIMGPQSSGMNLLFLCAPCLLFNCLMIRTLVVLGEHLQYQCPISLSCSTVSSVTIFTYNLGIPPTLLLFIWFFRILYKVFKSPFSCQFSHVS